MTLKIAFGIAAHREPDAVADLVRNLSETCPNSTSLVFDGASDPSWRAGADLPIARSSRPLSWGHLSDLHHALMVELEEADADYDCLVIVDSDMLMIKRGFEELLAPYLERFAFLGYDFQPASARSDWSTGRRFMYHWRKKWQPLLGAQIAYGASNAGQVFRRDLCRHLAHDDAMPHVLDVARSSRTIALEEMIYPTLAVAAGFPATALPGGHGVTFRYFTRAELELFAADPTVHFVHKVSLDIDAEDRRTIHELVATPPAPDALRAPELVEREPEGSRDGLRWLRSTAAGDLKRMFRS